MSSLELHMILTLLGLGALGLSVGWWPGRTGSSK